MADLSKPFVVTDVSRNNNGSGNLTFTSADGRMCALVFQDSPRNIGELRGTILHVGIGLGWNSIYLGHYKIMDFAGPAIDPRKRLMVSDVTVVQEDFFTHALTQYQREGVLPKTSEAPVRRVFSIDTETTGLDPGRDQLLSVAIVPVVNGTPADPKDTFHVWIKRDRYWLSPGVAGDERFLKSVQTAQTEGVKVGEAERLVHQYLSQFPEKKLVPLGKNFWKLDGPMLRQLDLEVEDIFHHRSIDIGDLYLRPSDLVPPGLKECYQRAGLGEEIKDQHDALADAYAVARMYEVWFRNQRMY